MQDTFGIQLAQFEGRSALRTWLFALLQRVASNHRRTQRRKLQRLEPLVEVASSRETPHARAEAVETLDVIQRFCDTLDGERRAVFVLALLEEVPAPEVSEALGIPVNRVYSRVRALREGLRRAFERREDGDG